MFWLVVSNHFRAQKSFSCHPFFTNTWQGLFFAFIFDLMFSFIQIESLSSQVMYLFDTKFLKIFNTMTFKRRPWELTFLLSSSRSQFTNCRAFFIFETSVSVDKDWAIQR